MDRAKLIIIIFAVAVAMLFIAAVFLKRDSGPAPSPVEIKPITKLDAPPAALETIFDFAHSDVKPYNMSEADFLDGWKQYTLSYRTGHLEENYNSLSAELVGTYHFTIVNAKIDSNQEFMLECTRGGEHLSVQGSHRGFKTAGNGVITITFYTKT